MAESKGGDAKEQDPPTAVEGKEGEEGEEGAESGDFEQDNGTLKWTTHQCGGDVPSPRSGHSLSVLGGAAYLFGGMGEGGNRVDEDGVEIFGPTNEVFYCRLEASGSRNAMRWERCSTGGEAPLPRWGHTATVISKKEFVVIGGFHSDTNRFNDVHIFDTQKNMWIQPLETITDFTPRGNHISRKTGGAGAVPAPRGGHTTTMIGTSLVVFGGYGGMGYARRDFNDVAVFDVEAQDWVKMANIQGTAPEARSGHSASLHKDESIFYFGGWNAQVQFNDLHILNVACLSLGGPSLSGTDSKTSDAFDNRLSWETVDVSGHGFPRWGHSGCSVKAIPNWRMFVFGGSTATSADGTKPVTSCDYDNSVAVLDMGTQTWSDPGIEGDIPSARSDTPFAYDSKNSRLIMFGGWNGEWFGDMVAMDIGNIVGPPYAITGISPSAGPVTGGAVLTIRGIDFVDDDNITIRFLVPGGKGKKFMDVEGEFVNDTTLQCITPEFVDYGAGVVQVRISLRNQGFTTTFKKYSFFSVSSAKTTLMYGPGITSGTAAGVKNTFIVESRDDSGTRRTTSGDEFTVIVEHESGSQSEAEITYLDNGRYTVTFDLQAEGKYNISVVFEGTFGGTPGHIRGSPCQVTFGSLPAGQKVDTFNVIHAPLVEKSVQKEIGELIAFAKKTHTSLTTKVPANDQQALLSVMERMHLLETRQAELELVADRLSAHLAYIVEIGKGSSQTPRNQASIEEWRVQWAACKKRAPDCRVEIGPLITQASARTGVDISTYEDELKDAKRDIKQMQLWNFDNLFAPSVRMIDDMVGEQGLRQTKYQKLLHTATMLEMASKLEDSCMHHLHDIDDMLKFARASWNITTACLEYFETCHAALWAEIDADVMEEKAKGLLKKVRGQNKTIKWCDLYKVTEQKVKDFLATCPLIVALHHKSMRERHWKMLMKATGTDFTPPYEDPALKLGGLLALNLHEYGAAVDDITDQSQKEEKMETNLANLDSTWSSVDWLFDNFTTHEKGNEKTVKLVKINDEDFEALEADQLTCQAMLGSRYLATFEERVTSWNTKLNNIAEVVNLLNEIQRLWSYLEPLFIGSEEVKKELPSDAERFKKINGGMLAILTEAVRTANICESCNKPGLIDSLNGIFGDLDLCKKSLKEFLDGKRAIFPRFFFVSEAQLLDLLSNGSTPHKIIKYTTAVFLATGTLVLDPPTFDPNNASVRPKATQWVACVGREQNDFKTAVPLEGKPEVYLQVVLDNMISTLQAQLTVTIERYPTQPRVEWLLHKGADGNPMDAAQLALLVSAMVYVKEVYSVFDDIEAGNKNAMVEYRNKVVGGLNDLIVTTRTGLNKENRTRVMTMITMDAHSRDCVDKLIREEVQFATAFQWMSQLKQSVQGGKAVCDICDAQFDYSFEYLGNGGRLVITPLTDRIYVTATQALHLHMGCAPAGPAGTGKTESTKDLAAALGKQVYVINCSPEMDYRSMGNIFKGLAASGSWGCFDEFNRLIAPVLSVCTVQFKAVCDGIRAGADTVTVEGDTVNLDPTCGAFITMNPGYLGRSELPEGLKALFRPMTVMVPDLVLICENMMMAEGFEGAKVLARKFYGLYSLLSELLSKQLHYDWGLRAVKSVLVVAGGFKRAEPEVEEAAILMRALRDFNTPKIVQEDTVVFFGLLGDLFPGLDPPRALNPALEDAVKKACMARQMNPDDEFRLKIVQLEELLAIRHCVFVMGPPGAGKTECWKTLAAARKKMGQPTKLTDLNPKAISPEELYGFVSLQTREWKDGVLSKTMRELGLEDPSEDKWIMLDGDLDANWIESMNSVMDDNRMLTLASNERVPLKGNMRMIFEIRDLVYATPATVSRAGILYISTNKGTQWKSLIESWVQRRDSQGIISDLQGDALRGHFIKYVAPTLKWLKQNTHPLVACMDINMVQTLVNMLDGLCVGAMKKMIDASGGVNEDEDELSIKLEPMFVFCCIWAFGSCLSIKDGVDYRKIFSDYWKSTWRDVKVPSRETVFDYWLNPDTNAFDPWKQSPFFFPIEFDSEAQAMSQVTVPTPETASVSHWMGMLADACNPIMLVGNAGCGKTQLVSGLLNSQNPEKKLNLVVNFNFYTNADLLKRTLEGPLEKKTGTTYAPKGQAGIIYFLDDLNLPEVDVYDTQSAISLVRQHMDYSHWYDMTKITCRTVDRAQYVACLNHTAGCFEINPRLQRHFATFAIGFPGPTSLLTIYQTFLDGHLKNFPEAVREMSSSLINAALGLHQQVASKFRKTAKNFHYEFNVRHVSNVFQGLLTAKPDEFRKPIKFVELWLHESERVYGDRLVSYDDLKIYRKDSQAQVKRRFAKFNLSKYFAGNDSDPLIFCHDQEGVYDQVKSIDTLTNTMKTALKEYNETNAAMNLVLFEDAVKHIARIMRIILNPGGHALLVGVGGMGKQSLSKLAAHVCQYTTRSITLTSTYTVNDFKTDIAAMYMKAGVKDEGILFLFTDSQIADERFLVFLNDLLASGEIPDLFPPEDIDEIINGVTSKVKSAGIAPTRESCWTFFIQEIKKNLHMSLCFSPVGDDLRTRARKFPALVNCTVIDWFQPWPYDALYKVAKQFLGSTDLGSNKQIRESIENFFPYSFAAVNNACLSYLKTDRRFTYTTPKTYLEFLALYNRLVAEKNQDSVDAIERLQSGLMKLKETGEAVVVIEADLKIKLAAAEVKKEKAEGIAEVVSREKAIVEEETANANVEAKKCAVIQDEVTKIAANAQADLDAAEPLVAKAMAALDSLNKKDLGMCKTMTTPPKGVDDVFSAVMVLLAGVKTEDGSDLVGITTQKNGKVKDRSWGAAKKSLLGSVDQFLKGLLSYKQYVDEFEVPNINWREVRPYLEMEHFDVDVISGKNSAAGGLCSWVINIVTYHDTIVGVAPKRQALAEANARLAAASEKLTAVQKKVAELTEKLAKLRAEYDAAAAEKQSAIDECENGQRKLDLANRLTSALASENVRWAENVVQLEADKKLLNGDVLVASSFLSYIGPFTKPYRDKLLRLFSAHLSKNLVPPKDEGMPVTVPIPMTPACDPLMIISNEAEQAGWQSCHLPDDRVSMENGALVVNSVRWPLMIDPQLQGIAWIRQMEGKDLCVERLGQDSLMRTLAKCMQEGGSMLIENMGEKIDATLKPVIGRQTITRGRNQYIKLGDDEILFKPGFKLYMHTKLSNPHYPPEVQAECTLVNFTVTEAGLEDQLLALVVKKERPDLAEERAQLVEQNNRFKVQQKGLEDNILQKLAEAEGDITEDVELIEGLEKSKAISNEIAVKMEIAKKTQEEISITSEKYRPVASQGSLLFFLMNSLFKIHSYYMYSLNAFVVIFLHAIDVVSEKKPEKKSGGGFGGLLGGKKKGKMSMLQRMRAAAKKVIMTRRFAWNEDVLTSGNRSSGKKIERLPDLSDEELAARCVKLKESTSKVVFNYIRRGLFEKDKLTVATQLALKLMQRSGEIPQEEINVLILGPQSNDPGAMGPVSDWMPEALWPRLKGLESVPIFKSLGDDMIAESDDWRKWFNDEKPELLKLPGRYGEVNEEDGGKPVTSAFEQLLLLRAVRQDRLTSQIQTYIKSKLGSNFVEQPPFDMDQTYKETSPSTPVFFVLFPGVDPTVWVENLGKKHNISEEKGNFLNISMGQGQEERAELTMKTFSENGGWVFLQNVHLMPGWLTRLERTLELCSAHAHNDFRCFISAEPPPMPHWKTIPESLLQSCIKVANEAPADVKSNFRRAWANFSQERIESSPKPVEFKACLYTVCFFHSLILGRRKFGQQGWSRKYSFNTGDLNICADVCFSYIANNEKIPWDDMRYIFGEIMYGGHITDPWDRRTNSTYLAVLLQPHIFEAGSEMIPCYDPSYTIVADDEDNDDFGEEKDDGGKKKRLFATPDFAKSTFEDVGKYIESELPPEAPVLFGLHPNAEIGYLTNQASSLIGDILTLGFGGDEAADGGEDSGAGGMSVGSTLTNLLSRLPDNFDMIEVEEKAEPLLVEPSKGPYVIVAMQECTRMNRLVGEIRRSLEELEKGMSGALNMSESMEDLVQALSILQVPGRNPFHKCSWEKLAWWSKKGLHSWFADMLLRIDQLAGWSDELELPLVMWYPGLFNPMAFNTAVMQVTARQFGQPLDNMTTETHMTTWLDPSQVKKKPGDGAFIHGVFIEGARWMTGEDAGDIVDVTGVPTQGFIGRSKLKDLLPKVPVIYMKAVVVQPQWEPSSVGYMRHDPMSYDCPVYVTSFRGPTYVFLATLRTKAPVEDWILGGVALVLQSDD